MRCFVNEAFVTDSSFFRSWESYRLQIYPFSAYFDIRIMAQDTTCVSFFHEHFSDWSRIHLNSIAVEHEKIKHASKTYLYIFYFEWNKWPLGFLHCNLFSSFLMQMITCILILPSLTPAPPLTIFSLYQLRLKYPFLK